jgi:oxygen-independent coproporphyrinogen III oxidase
LSGIYIHIPFCKQACSYCDFHFSTTLHAKNDLVKAVCTEIALRKNELKNETIHTIYFGGGTPSILDTGEIESILNAITANYSLNKSLEITLEANPDDLTFDKTLALKNIGINRLSIGIQSFFDSDLLLMNRAHQSKDAENAIKNSLRAGFENITIDLIYGTPGLSNKNWRHNLEKILTFNIPHFSAYSLTIEPKTLLNKKIKAGEMLPPSNEQSAKQFEILTDFAQKNKYEHYEISNFARDKLYAVHNTAYWQSKSYLGIGPSAHSFDGTTRSFNICNNHQYIKSIQKNILPTTIEKLTLENKYNEFVLTRLRTMWGVPFVEIEKFGKQMEHYFLKQIKKHIEKQHVIKENNHFILTQKGKIVADYISADLFFVT